MLSPPYILKWCANTSYGVSYLVPSRHLFYQALPQRRITDNIFAGLVIAAGRLENIRIVDFPWASDVLLPSQYSPAIARTMVFGIAPALHAWHFTLSLFSHTYTTTKDRRRGSARD